MKLLDKLSFPEDLKKLNDKEYVTLSEEIRDFLIDSVSKTGGHLASNLGVVELTLSMFKAFDFKKDKVIFDVGHQSYVYKILTGRKEGFKKLRQYDGMSGFPKRNESKYDFFNTGHSSTSISAALGIARARDLNNEDYNVIAVIGDGALTGGMALEALNDVGFNKTKLIIILNDNQMSISKNVGGLSKYLNNIRMAPKYNKLKTDINASLEHSEIGKNIAGKISKVKDSIKQLVVPSMLFENMGVKYIGPIDGHDISTMADVLCKVKEVEGPVIIHTITQKGKGYALAEESPIKYHGVGPFNLDSGEMIASQKNSYSKAFGTALIKLSEENKKIVAITAAMPEGTGLSCYAKKFKNRIFDVGIAEEHAVTMAAGMASNGLKPIVAIYSTFLQRAYDQIIHDVCLQNLPVVFAIDRAGIVGEDGETHQGIMDVSFLSTIPNMTIIQPKCLGEVHMLLKYALSLNKPVAIRYPRGGDLINTLEPLKDIKEGRWELISKGNKVCVIAGGRMLQHAKKASDMLYEKGVNVDLINATFIKPIDEEMLDRIAQKEYNILIIEDNMLQGGLGSAITDYLSKTNFNKKVKCLGYEDFVHQGNLDILYKMHKLDFENISKEILALYD